eukprot:TRINITY_DN31317_c0_g1_i1.p1 TRINITY_DN31317_c0_g1~~TRINITY_DN31317_c0_g1_i1.p1  ORF type:complete len:602 (+),score=84.69 TRINITY_DN31317_c0_g1_i1:101-1906(+)
MWRQRAEPAYPSRARPNATNEIPIGAKTSFHRLDLSVRKYQREEEQGAGWGANADRHVREDVDGIYSRKRRREEDGGSWEHDADAHWSEEAQDVQDGQEFMDQEVYEGHEEDPFANGNGGAVETRRVVMTRIRNLARPEQGPLGGITLHSVHDLLSQVGRIQKIVCVTTPKTGPPLERVDAMVQYETSSAAQTCIETFHGHSLTMDSSNIMDIQYSTLEEIEVKGNNYRAWDYTKAPGVTAAAVAPAPVFVGGIGLGIGTQGAHVVPPFRDVSNTAPAAAVVGGGGVGAGGPRVVVAHVTNLRHPAENPLGGVTVEMVHRVFSACGVIEKIVCASSPKSGPPLSHVDAMVQFANPKSAAGAIMQLKNTSLTGDEYNHMKLQFSTNPELSVRMNNNRAHDYIADGSVPASSLGGIASGGLGPKRVPPAMDHAASFAGVPAQLETGHAATLAVPQPQPGLPSASERMDALELLTSAGLVSFAGVPEAGSPVIAVHITALRMPEVGPLGGLHVDMVHDMFSRAGAIAKIVCSTNPKSTPLTSVTALVQFMDTAAAFTASVLMDGASLTNDRHNKMEIQSSEREGLEVHRNCNRSWDYTLQPRNG